ncbi:5-methyltetrahydropteroyltriglutamate--homocysteine S-methyltransferase [Ktedonobacter racemifer]|uniref:5-methyltetrahydropteroyltriglutamate--homocysteine methyltransferase n=1 Tax=Ktedonobacter racemifer DSM 44963 TaxID=485913 RepID=D6TRJ6_KTERA|nr:5-methyltetrahydropteroyltriglutamate--homocysteine S-methyltransferase [Ktedonobacter racemifer]EFH85948.1 5-methyltetrahydropteroyltriglutamate/homocystei neS-methyltransferase [Ktedonobacter racemifer DSM 44963]
MVQAMIPGYPRLGARRELKKALEQFWSGRITETELLEQASTLRKQRWQLQHQSGLTHIPSNDFSLYDHVLDTIALVGAVPRRYQWNGGLVDLHTYFAMARGMEKDMDQANAVPAMEMTKWFDTNYHYIVPEFEPGQAFHLASRKPVEEFLEAKALGIQTCPVLLGPLSFLLLGKTTQSGMNQLAPLDALLPVYEEILQALAQAGAEWVQIDEPCLVLDLDEATRAAYRSAYTRLAAQRAAQAPSLRILLATYFGDLRENLPLALQLPIDALHLDLVRAPEQLEEALAQAPSSLSLSLGLVDGRNIWLTDFEHVLTVASQAVQALGTERVLLGASCSLLHVPIDAMQETHLDEEMRSWLAFARQKVEEISLLTRALNEGRETIESALLANRQALESRRSSTRIHKMEVARDVQAITEQMAQRSQPYHVRKERQQAGLKLPLLPTTTLGSYPQTADVRAARAAYKSHKMDQNSYEAFLKQGIEEVIRFQEEAGLDMLVHGEVERGDMVEYFGEYLTGMLLTQHGWVQSYGSRAVRPPIIYGDVARPGQITVEWSRFAQSLTARPVRGMLTGPVTIMQWSFVRDDQPRSETCKQIALAIREEVLDLEAAGIRAIQIDEPALREGFPLHHADWQEYLSWAIFCFRLAANGVRDETQIHTHLCYSKFDDIVPEIASMDADVVLIEASRSQFDLLEALRAYRYPNGIGLGIYDVHSPHVPTTQDFDEKLRLVLQILPSEQLWVNPDCGLKTRKWEEVKPALKHMVSATQQVRSSLSLQTGAL